MSITILHFSDAHIGVEQTGRRDNSTDLSLRLMDYLHSLDTIIDTAIQKKVDMVLFSGDAYHSRTPNPTLQREWGRRIMRLSKAGIFTLLLVGNHDISPAFQRAHSLDSFITFDVPYVMVIERPTFLRPQQLNDLPLQVIALPWIHRSGLMANLKIEAEGTSAFEILQQKVIELVMGWIDQADSSLPLVLTAHVTVQGAEVGGYGTITAQNEAVLPPSLLKDSRLDYVGLGHIHKAQNLNEGNHPPVVYAGSIERVNFGEANEEKGFYLVHVEKGKTVLEWQPLKTRQYLTCEVEIRSPESIMELIWAKMPSKETIAGKIFRLILSYNRDWETLIDEAALRKYAEDAFEFKIVRRPIIDVRSRLPEGIDISHLSPLDLLKLYWEVNNKNKETFQEIAQLAKEIFEEQEQLITRGD